MGVRCLVVKADNSTQPVEEYEILRKSQKSAASLAADIKLYRDRVSERKIEGITAPAEDLTREGLDQWLRDIPEEKRKVMRMTNRNFRALQGANVPADEQKSAN